MSSKHFLSAMTIVLVLAILVMGAAFLLKGPAMDSYIAEKKDTVRFMLPESESFVEELDHGDDPAIQKVYRGQTGYVIEVEVAGYADDIRVMVGVDNSGKVKGVTLRKMFETLGLGTQAWRDYEFLMQFLNTDGDAAVGEDVDALTGATVTSKAIARAVNIAVSYVTGVDTGSGATSWGG